MKVALSNIAWTNDEEPAVAELLRSLGVKYVEVAPTKLWPDPTAVSDEELQTYKQFWNGYGIEIVAFQSMLFNRPDLKLFETESLRAETLAYLQKFITLAPKLGASVMVFGSPKNRQKGKLDEAQALAIAEPFFKALGDTAQANRTCFCIEPNPTDYACDFVTTAQQGLELVSRVDNPGFGLHLDMAGMTLAGDPVGEAIRTAGSRLRHFHASAPFLEPVAERSDVDYRAAAKALQGINYQGFVSIEMKPGAGSNLARVETAVRFVQQVFDS